MLTLIAKLRRAALNRYWTWLLLRLLFVVPVSLVWMVGLSIWFPLAALLREAREVFFEARAYGLEVLEAMFHVSPARWRRDLASRQREEINSPVWWR